MENDIQIEEELICIFIRSVAILILGLLENEELICIFSRSVAILILGALVMSSMLNYACRRNYFFNCLEIY